MLLKTIKRYTPIIFSGAIVLFFALIFIFNISPSERPDNSNEYKITGYDVNAFIQEDNKILIEEKIDVNFLVSSHGIFRKIPVYQKVQFYDNGKLKTKNYKTNVVLYKSSHEIDFYTSNDYFVLQLGSANGYANPIETYKISYLIDLGDDKITNFDQFYYNFIGNQWDTTISNVNIKIKFEKAVEDKEITFYVGTSKGDIIFQKQITNSEVAFTYNQTLLPYYGITGRTVFEEGFFTTEKQTITLDIVLFSSSIVFVIVGVLIYFKNKNKNKIIPTVEFKAPKGITPSDAGYIIDKNVSKGDISALIVYWANKGYLKIIEEENNIKLQKLKEDDGTFKAYEKDIFNSLFDGKEYAYINNKNIKLANAIFLAKQGIKFENSKYFSNGITMIKTTIMLLFSILIATMYYFIADKVALKFFSIFICILIGLIIFLCCYLLNYLYERKLTLSKISFIFFQVIIYSILLAIYSSCAYFLYEPYSNPLMVTIFVPLISFSTILLSVNLNNKIEGENKEVGKIFGLRNFILHAEKDRIEVLVEENPLIFYDILPYAYVLGITKKWIKKFEQIEIQTPTWYIASGSLAGTNLSLRVLSSMYLFNRAILNSQALIKPKIRHSKGNFGDFGGLGGGSIGGGMSGGGFGGGGGGRW